MLTNTERRELERQRAYHAACVTQYRDSAARIKNEKLSLRAIDNAQFHERKLEHINTRLSV